MSGENFYVVRQRERLQLAQLAEEHFKHDLTEYDRDVVKSAAKRVITYTTVSSILGISLGTYLAFRRRQIRSNMFQAFRRTEKPTHVRFADGREEAIPDITPMLAPSTAGTVLTYFLFSSIGLFLGTQLGSTLGSYSAMRTIQAEPETSTRVRDALKKLRVDMLKSQIKLLEGRHSPSDSGVDQGEKLLEE